MFSIKSIKQRSSLIILVDFHQQAELRRVEMHQAMPIFKPNTLPSTHVVKQCLSQYFFNQAYTNSIVSSPSLNAWMKFIYQLNSHFSSLDILVNRPTHHLKLAAQLHTWSQGIDDLITTFQQMETCSYSRFLLASYREKLQQSLQDFLAQAQSTTDVCNLYAQHDMSISTKSLGRWLSEELYHCLNMAYKGAKYFSHKPWKNLLSQDPAVLAIATAQDLIYAQSFGFSGIAKIHPYHPIDPDLAHRLTITRQKRVKYQIPKHDLRPMEHLVANLFNLSLKQFQSGNHLLLSAAQFLSLPYELALMLLDLLLRIIWILPYSYLNQNKVAAHANNLNHWHHKLSLYQWVLLYKNNLIIANWKQKLANHPHAVKLLRLSLSQENLFCQLPKLITHIKPQKPPEVHIKDWIPLKQYLQQLPLPLPRPLQSNTIDTLIYNPINQSQSVFDIIEEISQIMVQEGILPYFRAYPLSASIGLILNLATLLSFHYSLSTIPLVDNLLSTLQQLNACIAQAYFGKMIDKDLVTSIAACFLCWQLPLSTTNLTQKFIYQQEIRWLKQLLQHPDKLSLVALSLILLGYLEAAMPLLPTEIRIGRSQRLFNPLFAFLNFIHLEAEKCRHGQIPFSSFSLGILGVKSSLFLLNMVRKPSQIEETSPTIVANTQANRAQNLLTLLLGIYHHDRVIKNALSQPKLAKTYFLNLAAALKPYEQELGLQADHFLQQFHHLYCNSRLPNLLRLLAIALLPLHLIQWAWGQINHNTALTILGHHQCAEDLYLISQCAYIIIQPILHFLRICIDDIILPLLRLPAYLLIQMLPPGALTTHLRKFDDYLSDFNLSTRLIHWLRPLKVLHAKLSFHAGIYPQLGAQAEQLIEKLVNKKTQAHDLGFKFKH